MFKIKPSKPVLFKFAFKRLYALKAIAVVTLISVLFTSLYLCYGGTSTAYAASDNTSTINFQARLMNASGSIVPDGCYNVQFQLFNVATGGTALWTESYTYASTNSGISGTCYSTNGTDMLNVVNGYLTVPLGSLTAFSTAPSINWNQPLYLTINIGGTSTTSVSYDGAMSPSLPLTGVPYAFTAGELAQYNGTYTSTLQLAAPTSGNQTFTIPDQGAAGSYDLLTTTAANADYIQNTSTLQSGTANFNISGTGIANTSLLTPDVDALTAGGTLYLGSGNAASGAIYVGYGMGTGSIYIGGGGQTGTITMGRSTATNTIDIGTVAGDGYTQTIKIGTSTTSGSTTDVTIGSTIGGATTLQGEGMTNALTYSTTTNTPSDVIKTTTNSTSAFEVEGSGGTNVLDVDTTDSYVNVAGPVLQTGMKTSNTSSDDENEWTELGACTLTAEYTGCSTVVNIVGGMNGSTTDNSQAQVGFRVYQQNVLGDAPYVVVNVGANAEDITSSDIVAIPAVNTCTNSPTCSTGTTTVELWAYIVNKYEAWDYTPTQIDNTGGVTLSWTPVSGFVTTADLPSPSTGDSNFIATYNDLLGSTLTIQGAANVDAVQVENAGGINLFNVDTSGDKVNIGSTGTSALQSTVNIATSSSISNIQTVNIGSESDTSNSVTIEGGEGTDALALQAGTGGTISIGTSNNNILDLGTGMTTGTITIGGTTQTGITIIGDSSDTNEISIGAGSIASGNTQTIAIGTAGLGTGTTDTYLGSTVGSSLTSIYGGTEGDTLSDAGDVVQSYTNSTTAFEVEGSTTVLDVDTTHDRVGIGTAAPAYPLDVVGDINTSTTYSIAGATVLQEVGTNNILVGGAGNNTIGGTGNVGISAGALNDDTSGSFNFALGGNALFANTTGSGNVAIGIGALQDNVGGIDNIGIGQDAGLDMASNNLGDTLIGYGAASNLTGGGTAGGYDTIIGLSDLSDTGITSGGDDIIIGADDFASSAPAAYVSGDIIIGNNINTTATSTGTNYLNIGNVLYGNTSNGTGYLESNSTTAFQVQSSSATVLDVDTTNGGKVTINNNSSGSASIASVQEWDNHGASGLSTLSVAPHTVGNVMLLAVYEDSSGNTITSVTGGGVSNWSLVSALNSPGNYIYEGTVTSTGASTITVNYSGSQTSWTEIVAQEFTAGLGADTDWSVISSNGINNTSSTTVTFPSLTATQSDQLYWGYASLAGAGSVGSTSGFSYKITSGNNVITYDPNTSATTYTPTASQSPAGISAAVAVILSASLSDNALTVNGSSTIGGTVNSSDTFQVLNASGDSMLNVDSSANSVTILQNAQYSASDGQYSFTLADNLNAPNEAVRWRVNSNGANLESGGTDLYISGWTNANFSGSQLYFARGDLNTGDLFIGNAEMNGTSNPLSGDEGVAQLVLDSTANSSSDSGDPPGFNGSMYYNAYTNEFRCYQDDEWVNCISIVQTHNLNEGATAGNTTSESFVAMPGPQTLTFTKAASSTNLLISIQTSLEDNAQGTFELGFSVDSSAGTTDYTCMEGAINTAVINDHMSFSCSKLVSDIPAGSVTVEMLWETGSTSDKLSQSAGTGGDWISFTAQETS